MHRIYSTPLGLSQQMVGQARQTRQTEEPEKRIRRRGIRDGERDMDDNGVTNALLLATRHFRLSYSISSAICRLVFHHLTLPRQVTDCAGIITGGINLHTSR